MTIVKLSKPVLRRHKPLISIALLALSGCEIPWKPVLEPVNASDQSYVFQCFSLTPPESANWYRGENTPKQVVFYNNTNPSESLRLTAVVTHLETSLTAEADEAFDHFIARVLQQRLSGNTRQALLKLTTKPDSIAQADCASYEAWQGERYFPPIFRQPRLEAIHHGYVCRHPQNSQLLIQGFYTEHRLMLETETTLPKPALEQAEKLIRQIEFTPCPAQ